MLFLCISVIYVLKNIKSVSNMTLKTHLGNITNFGTKSKFHSVASTLYRPYLFIKFSCLFIVKHDQFVERSRNESFSIGSAQGTYSNPFCKNSGRRLRDLSFLLGLLTIPQIQCFRLYSIPSISITSLKKKGKFDIHLPLTSGRRQNLRECLTVASPVFCCNIGKIYIYSVRRYS